MKNIFSALVFAIFGCLALSSCSKDKTIEVSKPKITFDNGTGVYEVKVGRDITITPIVEVAENPSYSWIMEGQVVSTHLSYRFTDTDAEGEYYLTFKVTASNGTVQEDVRVDVLPLQPPVISLPVTDEDIITAVVGRQLVIQPSVVNGDYATFQWFVDGEDAGTSRDLVFRRDAVGDYDITLTVRNEDGTDTKSAVVRVGPVPSVSIFFEKDQYSVPRGRKIVLAPYISDADPEVTYTWKVDNVVQPSSGPILSCDVDRDCMVELVAQGAYGSDSKTVMIKCVEPEGTYKRAKTADSNSSSDRVFEFLPAPGQFVNEGYTAADMRQACEYAQSRLDAGDYVSLGAFGGYIVVGFDHSIERREDGEADFAVLGNAFSTSSEAGIIWVMQDENGDGEPNDTWYELKGSEFGKEGTNRNYAVTYYKPSGPRQAVRWVDNMGNTGTVNWLAIHAQDSYYPAWVDSPSYTLRGTCLGQNTSFDPSIGWQINEPFDWGYADNLGADYKNNALQARIENAVYADGTPADLEYIDFVKIQTAINGKAGALGEISTEVCGVRDLGL